ncbi:MAG: formylglycine-generating enzyme family protein [Methylococcales bacterium]|nr:formylglycine-generating enzyme family protein [Methylococcales bacterium]
MPVEQVSENDVQDFINKLNTQTGKSYRLPTEAEWEYAARAGTTSPFYTGDCINTQQANYDGNSQDYNNCGAKTGVYKQTTVAVGSYPANPWGLYDMAGNVWEWTCSAYVENYDGSEKQCSSKNDASTSRVLRGGSWYYLARYTRSARRYRSTPVNRLINFGFRFALGQTAS